MPTKKRTKPASPSSHEKLPKRIEDEENAFWDLPPEVWGVVVGYLNTRTLGRLVLQTSKRLAAILSATVASSNDDAWKLILYHLWGMEASLELLERTTWNAEACVRLLGYNHFFNWPSPNGRDPDPSSNEAFHGTFPRPLRFVPEDYLLVVTAIGDHGRYWDRPKDFHICKAIRGSEIPDFFSTGKARVTFPEPLWTITNKPYPFWSEASHFGPGMRIGYTTCVTIIRLPDKKTVRSSKCKRTDYVGDLKDCSGRPHFHYWDCVYGGGTIVSGPYMSRNYGKPLMRHLGLRDGHQMYCQITIEASLHYMPTRTNNGTEDLIGAFGFNLEAGFQTSPFNDIEGDVGDIIKEHPHLTFAHFLDAVELRDWEQKLSEVKTEVRNKRGYVCNPEFISDMYIGEIYDEPDYDPEETSTSSESGAYSDVDGYDSLSDESR